MDKRKTGMTFHVIPVKPIPVQIREMHFTQHEHDMALLDCNIIAITLTPDERPRFTVIETDSHGMYHDIDFLNVGALKTESHHLDLGSYKRICPNDKPVVTNYLEYIQNKRVCLFTEERKFLGHGLYHLSLEWNTEIWHLITGVSTHMVAFQPTHKLLWNSTFHKGDCKNDHKLLPPWEKQRSYYK